MTRLYVVVRTRSSSWDHLAPLRSQPLWHEHAAFIDGIVDAGVLRLAGPLEGGDDVLLIFSAESPEAVEATLADDPWTAADVLRTTRIIPWNVLVGALA